MAIPETNQITEDEASLIVAQYLSGKSDVKEFRSEIEGRGIVNLPEDKTLQQRLEKLLAEN